MKPGDELEVEFSDLAYGGDAVGRSADGRIVFAPLLAPGDAARVRIERLKKDFAVARAIEVTRPGPDRVAAPCRFFGDCGGCQWQHVALCAQRAAKEKIVRRLLAPMNLDGRVSSLRHGGEPYGYRNRLILPLRQAGGGSLKAGFFRASSHEVVEVESCLVQHETLWGVAHDTVRLIRDLGIPGYDEAAHEGILRHLLVRRGAGTGNMGVVLVATRPNPPGIQDLAAELSRMHPDIKGIALSVNSRPGNVIMGRKLTVIHGDGSLREAIRGLEFDVPFGAFFQANAEVTGIMLDLVKSWAGEETQGILDLYCGVGILGQAAMASSSAAWLAGIEENGEAARAAHRNARVNGIEQRARYVSGDAGKVLPGLVSALEGIGTVIVDPPRKGLASGVIERINALKARRLIYVSCDPATFARDLRKLAEGGFRLAELVPLDMFPQTYHLELMARMVRD